jgi:hypothetical protein
MGVEPNKYSSENSYSGITSKWTVNKSTAIVKQLSGSQNVTAAAEARFSKGGAKVALQGAQKPALIVKASSATLSLAGIAVSHISCNSEQNKKYTLTASKEKYPSVIFHRHFRGDKTKTNKDFHSDSKPMTRHEYDMNIRLQGM